MVNPYNFDIILFSLKQLTVKEEGNGISVMRGIVVSRGFTYLLSIYIICLPDLVSVAGENVVPAADRGWLCYMA